MPISSHELLGHHNQINQKLDESIEEKLKIEIKKDEEEEKQKNKTQSIATQKGDMDLLRDDEEDPHFDDLPYQQNILKESSRSYNFNHGYVAELLDKEDQLKKAQNEI